MQNGRGKWLAIAILIAGVLLIAVIDFRPRIPFDEEVGIPEAERSLLVLVDGLLVQEGTSEPFSGYMVEYYEDGSYKTRSRIEEGKLHGMVRGWFPDGTLESEEPFVHGVSHGVRQRWYENGTLAARTEIVEGEVHGEFKTWDEDGHLIQRIAMSRGQPHGVSESYYPSGYLRTRVKVEQGQILSQESWDNWVMR
jgi:antitoxin component YwqK of YwqJK toxin-antitoxin module